MRRPRLKLNAQEEEGYYHCISRVGRGAWLLKEEEKEVLRKQLWAVAEYCGVEVLTYALMSNHYHILLKVPRRRNLTDAELLRRYRALYPKLKGQQEKALAEVEADMANNGPKAQAWRQRQLRQMFDVSQYNKLLKMRFSIWYNRRHQSFGTFWSSRFTSVLVEGGDALEEIALYIDMNPCRAKLVKDPIHYRFCGFAEAVAGIGKAREGLQSVYGRSWQQSAERHRAGLAARMLALAAVWKEIEAAALQATEDQGRIRVADRFGCRVRYFVEGVILGSEAFVRENAAKLPGDRKRQARTFDWPTGTLHVLGRLIPSGAASD